MKVFIVENAGFCFGVKRAIKLAFDAAKKNGKKVYTLGPLIHNPQVVEDLKKKGVHAIPNLKKVSKGCLIIRSHGVHPQVIKEAKKKGLMIIDATCPFVRRAQRNAGLLSDEGYQVVVVGEADHPEVKSIVGYAKDKALVLNQGTKKLVLNRYKKLGVVAQTTLNINNLKEVVGILLEKGKEIKIINTICSATSSTQKKTLKLASKVSLMVVVGGYNSANTSRLARLCQEMGTKTYHVETADQLKKSWFKKAKKVGITAGSSTPKWIIQEVADKIGSFDTNALKANSK